VPKPLAIRAYAKLNLALAVAPPEPAGTPRAGWHRLCSWMHAIDLADDLLLEADASANGPTLEARWADDAPRHPGQPLAWPADKDLTLRAARALGELVGRPLPVRITLRKRVPEGGGLGGGSADAAAALRGINRLLALGLAHDQLAALAVAVGSDVPFFLDPDAPPAGPPRPAIVGGFGEAIDRLARRHADVTLFCPPFGCPTPEVYAAFDRLEPGPMDEPGVRSAAADDDGPDPHALRNDLAAAAQTVRPELADIRRTLQNALGTPVLVTGSGSTLFAIGHHHPPPSLEGLEGLAVVRTRLA